MDHINDRKESADYSKTTSNAEAVTEHTSAQIQPPPFQLVAKESPVQESEESTTQEKTTQLLTANGEGPSQPNDNNEKPNNTGLPTQLKSGIENLSGFSLDDVKVHRNSDKPAQLQAHAYAQGTDIHLGPGQERHLPHEAWHVVQQKQGRVKPTMQMKAFNINDDAGLEKEADVMGEKAMNDSNKGFHRMTSSSKVAAIQNNLIQRVSLKEFKNQDPSLLSEEQIRQTNEYSSIKEKLEKELSEKEKPVTQEQLVLICQLILRELNEHDETQLSDIVANPESYYKSAISRIGTVAAFGDNFDNKNMEWQKNTRSKTGFYKKYTDSGASTAEDWDGDKKTLNCYEAVLYAAQLAGATSEEKLKERYYDFSQSGGGDWDTAFKEQFRGSQENVYNMNNPLAPKPLKGDIVVFNKVGSHVALATGNTIGKNKNAEILSFYFYGQDGESSLETTTIEALYNEKRANLKGNGEGEYSIKFWSPNW